MYFLYDNYPNESKISGIESIKKSYYKKIKTGNIEEFLNDSKRPIKRTTAYKEITGRRVVISQKLSFQFNIKGGNIKINVLAFLKTLDFDTSEYVEGLKKNSVQWFGHNQLNEKKIKAIEKWAFDKAKSIINAEYNQPEEIPEHLKIWLHKPDIELDNTIYETEEWIEKTNTNKFNNYWNTFKKLLINIIDNKNLVKTKINDEKLIKCLNFYGANLVRSENCYVLYKKITRQNEDQIVRNIFFLYDNFCNKPSEVDILNILEMYDFNEFEQMLPFARRAYPDWALADDDIWGAIEGLWTETNSSTKNSLIDFANLALSGEEEKMLQESTLPIFINGRAGSGKSTMLYYLFANYCKNKITRNLEQHAILLTYNENLVKTAKATLTEILTRNVNYELSPEEKEKVDPLLEESVLAFQAFIKDKLIKNSENFKDKNHLTFYKFKKYYLGKDLMKGEGGYACRLSEKNNYSPEIVWYTIRTFIKGFSLVDLDVNAYQETEEKDRSITKEDYEIIYEKLYNKWYKKKLINDFWDDTDIVRKALYDMNIISENTTYCNFPVIFCDEAQDFTRLELDLLLKLNQFSLYNIQLEKSIPFAFAGDPLQTLNPTGFKWERFKANFYCKFEQLSQKSELKIKELTKNYRSNSGIVKLSNLVQYTRSFFLKEENIKPQDWWQKKKEITPLLFILNDNIKNHQLADSTCTITILPVEEGQEMDFIKNDDCFKSIYTEKLANINTTLSIKGLEFPKVILYKFGDVAGEILNDLKNLTEKNDDTNIKAAYFFNKLYVGITRAKEILCIIDSEKGLKNLWSFLQSMEIPQEWKDMVGYFTKATEAQIEILKTDEREDFTDIAEEYSKKADPESLRNAAYYYRLADEETKAITCEVRAFEIEKKWKKAAQTWEQVSAFDKASNCYWKAKEWNEIYRLFENKKIKYEYKVKVAEFMKSENKKITEDMLKSILSDDVINNVSYNSDDVWQEIINEYNKKLRNSLTETKKEWQDIIAKIYSNNKNWRSWSNIIDQFDNETGEITLKKFQLWEKVGLQTQQLADKGFGSILYNNLANLYFYQLKDWKKTKFFFNSSKKYVYTINEYNTALYMLADNESIKIEQLYNGTIFADGNKDKYDNVIDKYKDIISKRNIQLDKNSNNLIVDSYQLKEKDNKACEIALKLNMPTKAIDIIQELNQYVKIDEKKLKMSKDNFSDQVFDNLSKYIKQYPNFKRTDQFYQEIEKLIGKDQSVKNKIKKLLILTPLLQNDLDLCFNVFTQAIETHELRESDKIEKFIKNNLLKLDVRYENKNYFNNLSIEEREFLSRYITDTGHHKYVHIFEIPSSFMVKRHMGMLRQKLKDDFEAKFQSNRLSEIRDYSTKVVDKLLSSTNKHPEDWFLAVKIMLHPIYDKVALKRIEQLSKFINLVATTKYIDYAKFPYREWRVEMVNFVNTYYYKHIKNIDIVAYSEIGCVFEKLDPGFQKAGTGYKFAEKYLNFYEDMLEKVKFDQDKKWIHKRLISVRIKNIENLKIIKQEIDNKPLKNTEDIRKLNEITDQLRDEEGKITKFSSDWNEEIKYEHPVPLKKDDAKEKYEIAIKLLETNVNIQAIAYSTGLSEEEINKLQQSINKKNEPTAFKTITQKFKSWSFQSK